MSAKGSLIKEGKVATPDAFDACVAAVQAPHSGVWAGGEPPIRPTVSQKLELYGLYKQALFGDDERARPWPWQVTECAKWDAWHSRRGMSRPDARKSYVEAVRKLLPPPDKDVIDPTASLAIARLRFAIGTQRAATSQAPSA